MQVHLTIVALLISTCSASSQQPTNQGFATADAASCADAAQVLIAEGLKRLEPMLDSLTGPPDTMYISYPYIFNAEGESNYADPPQAFLDRISNERISFLPFSEKPVNWRGRRLSIWTRSDCSSDTALMDFVEDCSAIKIRALEKGQIFVTPTSAGASVKLVRQQSRWEIVEWRQMMME